MNTRHLKVLVAAVAAALVPVSMAGAGSFMELGLRVSDEPSPIPGLVLAEFEPSRWMDACIPVHFALNTTIDPILDPDGVTAMSLADARVALQGAMESWNDIPTSYIELRLDRVTQNSGTAGFDFTNEVTFRSDHLSFPPTVSGLTRFFFAPRELEATDGLDYDGDGDADFRAGLGACRDIDNDGDIELPAGRLPAGTLLDTDVYFFPQFHRYADLVADPLPPSAFGFGAVDLEGVAAHEFGHSLGLNHSIIVDTNRNDGSSATMNPGYPTTDGYVSIRSLHSDDIAWSSFLYQEGSRKFGPAALKKGDVAFRQRYALIKGEVREPNGRPLIGAQPYAVDTRGAIVTNGISGRLQVAVNPQGGGFLVLFPEDGIVNGRYTLPVPRGIYHVGVESADGLPIFSGSQNVTEAIGRLYDEVGLSQLDFPEEFWSGPLENSREFLTSLAWPVVALTNRSGIDFGINDAKHVIAVNGDDPADAQINLISSGAILAARIPTERLLALDAGRGISIQAALFGATPLFEEESVWLRTAMITTGRKKADGSIELDLRHPLVRESNFAIGSWELNSMPVPKSAQLGDFVTQHLAGSGKDLFVVAVHPEQEHSVFPGQGFSPVLALFKFASAQEPLLDESYVSFNGGASFQKTLADLYLGLVVATR